MPLHPNALTTVARLRAWLSPEAAPETAGRLSDEALEALLHRASGAIESYCDRVLLAPAEPVVYTFDGDGRARLVLPEWPVVAVSAVSIDGDTVPQRTLDEPFGYVVRETAAWLELVGYRFTAGVGNVSVSARLGYDAALAATNRLHQRALDDLEQACLLLARAWFEKPAAARETVALGGAVEQFTVDPWPAEVRGLLAPYRRLGG